MNGGPHFYQHLGDGIERLLFAAFIICGFAVYKRRDGTPIVRPIYRVIAYVIGILIGLLGVWEIFNG